MTFRFAGHFRKNMLILACAMGVLISILTPLTYLVLALDGVKREVEATSCYIANSIFDKNVTGVLDQQVLEQLDNYVLDDIGTIKIYNNQNQLVSVKELEKTQFYSVMTMTPISAGNIKLGYVEVTQNTDTVFFYTVVLLFGFGLFGTLSGILLYKFPTKIVNKSEERISQIMMKLEQLSYYDMLTNLPNRVMLDKSLMDILEVAERRHTSVGIFFLDLDRFKLINDTMGHAYGDILLKSVAERLRNHKHPNEIIARQGGDEFIIVLPDFTSIDEIEERAIEIIQTLSQPFEISEQHFTVTTSVGISLYPDDGIDIKTLIKHADLAMYMAKEQGKNKYCFYSLETRPKIVAL